MAKDEGRGRGTADLIDDNLKRIFQQEAERDLPDRFTDLIAKLREKEAASGQKKAEK